MGFFVFLKLSPIVHLLLKINKNKEQNTILKYKEIFEVMRRKNRSF